MSLKKAIQDLIDHSKQHQEGLITEKLPSCRECHLLPDFEADDPFIKFWNTYRIINTQAIYPSERTKKAYEALVGEVLSAEDALTEQKDITRITALAKLVVLSIEYTHEPNYRATDIAYEVVAGRLDPKEGLYEFRKKGTTSKNLASYLLKHLRELLKN